MNVTLFKVSNHFIKNQCYLVDKNNAGLLIDPAWDFKLITDFLNSHSIALKAILLTHSHYDHTDLAERFSEMYTAPVLISAIEKNYYNFNCPNIQYVKHLQETIIENFTILPILTPGHTCGSTCYLINNHLFTGDTVFIEGIGICTGPGSDVNQMYDSIQLLKSYLRMETLIWPGHSFGQEPGKNMDFILKNNIYFQFDSRKQFVEFRTRKNQPDPFKFG